MMKRKTTLKFYTVILLAVLMHKNSTAQSCIVTVKNPSAIAFRQHVFEIPWAEIEKRFANIDTAKLIVLDASTNKQLLFQLETKGTNTIQNLLLQIDVKPLQIKKIKLAYGKRIPFTAKTFGRYVPERKDDFAWENDKTAYRMYGKALELTPAEMAYGIDVWVKRVDRLILNERYKLADYHKDHGDGLDYYSVGKSLGAGNIAPYINDSVYYDGTWQEYKVLDNGPLRTSFKLTYKAYTVGNNIVTAVKTISLDAGSQLNKISVQYNGAKDAAMQVVAGIITRKGVGVKYLDEAGGILSYWEPKHGDDGTTAVACIFTTPVLQMTEAGGQLLAKIFTDKNYSIIYFAGAAWDKAGQIKNADEWNSYLRNFQQQQKTTFTYSYQFFK